ncbi:MAG: hypothetical protein JNM45_02330 [Rhizobiales bacterium]|nr:hypothetical protein [Hyphomicrobiales bacterium]
MIMHKPLETTAKLLAALETEGVDVVHWKSNHHLAEALAGDTDLDVLVRAADLARFRDAATMAGALRIISPSWASYPGVEDWLLHDGAAGKFLHLHVHTQLVTGLKRVKHLILPWTDHVLSHRRREPASGWPVPQAEEELLVLLIRIWAKMPPFRRLWRPQIPRHIMAELRWLEGQVDLSHLRDTATELGLSLPALPPFPDQASILKTARHLYGQVQRHRRMSWPVALAISATEGVKLTLRKWWSRKLGPIRYRKQLARQGAMVALIGSDGSGKSTQSGRLIKWLTYKLDAHLVYMGSGDGRTGLANGLRKLLSRSWKKSRGKAAAGPSQASQKRSLPARLWRLFDLLLLRRKLRLLRLARRMADRGSIILLDRYPQNQIDGVNDGPRQSDGRGFAWAAAMERRLLAEAAGLGPDLVIKLRVSPDVALSRKPDHDRTMIERKCAVVDALQFGRAETVVLDADAPVDDVTQAAKAALWSFLAARNTTAMQP